jgi:hypothetical protein
VLVPIVMTALAAAFAAAPAAPATAATTPPGGKANWVVAVGGLNTAEGNGYRNWVRLGYYVFGTDGTVVHNYWNWSQRDQPVRVNSVTADCTGDVPDCAVKTVDGFLAGPMGGFTGTYSSLADGRVQVRWTRTADGTALGTPLTENWTVTGFGGVARIASPTFYADPVQLPAPGAFSSYSATYGVGYGSNATFDSTTRASMSQLRNDSRYNARRYTGTFPVAKQGIVGRETSGGPWWFGSGSQNPGDANFANPWQVCANGACLGWNQHGTGCDCGATWTDKDRIRYIAEVGGGRRNTEWYWCQCLAQGAPCYQANSHPRPLLQIVDDAGVFQGWVGVEAFTHVNSSTLVPDGAWASGFWGVFDMVPDTLK